MSDIDLCYVCGNIGRSRDGVVLCDPCADMTNPGEVRMKRAIADHYRAAGMGEH